MDFIEVLLWNFNYVLNFGFGEVFYFDFFRSVDSSERWSEIDFTLVLKLYVWFCACAHESHFGVCAWHVI